MYRGIKALVFVCALLTYGTARGSTINVPADQPTIQAGIDAAVDGDTVMIAPGTYFEYEIDFLGRAITVMSTYPGDPGVVAATIIDGGSMGRVFNFHSGEDSTSVLAGLTITNGWADYGGGGVYCSSSPTISNNIIAGNSAYYHGGGIFCDDSSSPTIRDNTITGNSTGYYGAYGDGGGIYCGDYSSPTITGNTITGNSSTYRGGAIFCSDYSTPMMSNNTIIGNSAGFYGGAIFCDYTSTPTITGNTISGNTAVFWGGAIYCENYSTPIIADNIITGNSADIYGGGIYCDYYSVPVITNNIIAGNSAVVDGWGGGIYCWRSAAIITNNLITGNSAGNFGGGIFLDYYSNAVITNNTVTDNSAGGNAGGVYCNYSSDPIITNTIIWGNDASVEPDFFIWDDSNPIVTYSDIGGGWWGVGNIDADPLFEDGEYHLQPGSPCVDAGDPAVHDACLPPGLATDRSDMGAYGGAENCWWPEFGVDLIILPDGPLTTPRGGTLSFNTFIVNNTANTASGDYWLSALLPDLNEIVVPEAFLNHSNPLSGQIPPFGSVNLPNELLVPTQADVGSYSLIGRIGVFPGTIIDEESFDFQVIE